MRFAEERIDKYVKISKNTKKIRGGVFAGCIVIILLIAIFLRLSFVDFQREIVQGDETAYHYAAENLLKYGMFTIDRDGAVYQGKCDPEPTSALQIGYPLVLALLYTLFEHSSQIVFIFQFILSIVDLLLLIFIMYRCRCKNWVICLVLLLAAIYPGFIYNINRMLTEQLFKTLLLGFAASFLYALQVKSSRKKTMFYIVSAIILGFAVFTRGLAFPFLFLVLFIIFFYDTFGNKKNMVVYAAAFSATQFWWWIRNVALFHKVMLLTDAGFSPKIWGMMPYYLDMASSEGMTVGELLQQNEKISLPLFIRWRSLGTINYLWSDIWDEGLVHEHFRGFLWIHMVLLATALLLPILIRRCNAQAIFITSFPIAFTVMNLPYHGLPRYLYPSLPFLFIAFGMLLSRERLKSTGNKEETRRTKIRKVFENSYFVVSVIFSIFLACSLLFGYQIHREMSDWRLHKYLNTSISEAESGELIAKEEYFDDNVVIENCTKNGHFYENCVDAPSIIKLDCQTVSNDQAVTKVTLNIQGGYLSDYMTVYWKKPDMDVMNEDHVYHFPIHKFQKKQVVYIDGDVDSLMIVPACFRGSEFEFSSIIVEKVKVKQNNR